MRKGLLVSGMCGCAVAAPAVAQAAIPDATQPAIGAPGAHESKLRVDAAAKLRTTREIPKHKRLAARAKKDRARARRRAAEAQTAAQSGGSTSSTGPQSAGGASPALQAIAACESGGNPSATNGQFRGKYQFDSQTWASVGGTGDPAAASPAEQDMRAQTLLARQGTTPWPVCGAGK